MTWRGWLGVGYRPGQAGDTIVEVLLAIIVVSVVITGAYQVTNRGLRIGQNSIERTQASETTSAQAEALRTLRDQQASNAAAASTWSTVMGKATATIPAADPCATGGGTPTSGSQAFWLDTTTNNLAPTNGTKTVRYLKYWVEAYQPAPTSGYIDFYVNGCWQAIGEEGVQNTGIVVRLTTE